jgi:hypothetical protein
VGECQAQLLWIHGLRSGQARSMPSSAVAVSAVGTVGAVRLTCGSDDMSEIKLLSRLRTAHHCCTAPQRKERAKAARAVVPCRSTGGGCVRTESIKHKHQTRTAVARRLSTSQVAEVCLVQAAGYIANTACTPEASMRRKQQASMRRKHATRLGARMWWTAKYQQQLRQMHAVRARLAVQSDEASWPDGSSLG